MSGMPAVIAVLIGLCLCGKLLLDGVLGRPADGWQGARRWAEGYLLGVVGLGCALWIAGTVALASAGRVSLIAGAILVPALFAMRHWRWRHAASATGDAASIESAASRRAALAIAIGLLATFVVIAVQAWSLPTLTWDAWNAWLSKPKAWHAIGSTAPVAALDAWMASPDPQLLTTVAAGYPEALPRTLAWLIGVHGPWRDAALHVLWPLLWLALGILLATGLRRAGGSALVAVGSAGFLLTLPMVSAHASLAGYSDLWLAAAILAGAQRMADFLDTRRWPELIVAAVFFALLPCIKLEGAIYLGTLTAAGGASLLLPRYRALLVVALPLVLLACIRLWPIEVPLPGLGWVRLEWGAVTLPLLGRLDLAWHPVAETVLTSLLLLPNWSLLWYLTPLALLYGWRRLRAPATGAVAIALLLGWLFHFVLFFFTYASAWAEDLTSLNRLLLHLVPVQVYLLARVLFPSAHEFAQAREPARVAA